MTLLAILLASVTAWAQEPAPGNSEDNPYIVTTWADLKAKMEAGGYIRLDADVTDPDKTSGSYLYVPSGKTVTLDLNGHTIDRGLTEKTTYGFVIKVDGTLTLNDSSNPSTGTITGGYDYGDSDQSGGGVFVTPAGLFIMNGGTIIGNKTSNYGGGGVYVGRGGVNADQSVPSWIGDTGYTVGVGGTIYIPLDAQVTGYPTPVVSINGTFDPQYEEIDPSLYTITQGLHPHESVFTFTAPNDPNAIGTYTFSFNAGNSCGSVNQDVYITVGNAPLWDKIDDIIVDFGTTREINLHDYLSGSTEELVIAFDAEHSDTEPSTYSFNSTTGVLTLGPVDEPATNPKAVTDIFSFTASNKYSVINVSVTFNCIFRHPDTTPVPKPCTFVMNGGTITGNTASSGGGVCLDDRATFEMNGGIITGNTASSGGGGVYAYWDNAFIVSGSSVVSGNTNAKGKADNVYLSTDNNNLQQTLTVSGLTDGASIGVWGESMPDTNNPSPVVIATGVTAADLPYIHSDKTGYYLEADADGRLSLNLLTSTPWTALQALLDAGGTVTLTDDVTAYDSDGRALIITNTVTLDLAGHTITGNEKNDDTGAVIKIGNGNLILTDSDTGGTITGGKYGVTLADTHSSFTMTGGIITGNGGGQYGGGVYVKKGTFNVSGSPVITGNTNSSDKESNVYLPNGKTINVIGALSADALIGVKMKTVGTFAQGGNSYPLTSDDAGRFTSDASGYFVSLENNQASLTNDINNDMLTEICWGMGDGTENNPYLIKTTDGLELLAQRVNNGTSYGPDEGHPDGYCFLLMNNLSFTHTTAWDDATSTENNYTAIGAVTHPFRGVFDGAHHTISGIRINKTGSTNADSYQGLFGRVDGAVKNVFLYDCVIKGNNHVGAIAGKRNGSLTDNYYRNCTVNGSTANVGTGDGDVTADNGACSVYLINLPAGVTASGAVAASYGGTDYYTADTEITLGGEDEAPENYTYPLVGYSIDDVPNDGNTFTMPAADVTITTRWTAIITNSVCGSTEPDWNIDNATAFPLTVDESTGCYVSGEVTIPAGFRCKVLKHSVESDEWFGGNPSESGYIIVHNGGGDIPVINDDDSKEIKFTLGGTFTFTLQPDYSTLTIVGNYDNDLTLNDDKDNSEVISSVKGSSNMNVTLQGRTLYKDDAWNTLCLPFDVDLTDTEGPLYGATVKSLDNSAEGTNLSDAGLLTLKFVDETTTMTAGIPYIIKWADGADLVNPVFTGVTITSTAPTSVVSNDTKVTFVGQYSPFVIDDNNIDEVMLLSTDNKLGYSQSARTLRPFRAHFYIPTTNGARAVEETVFDFATSLNDELRMKHEESATGWYTLNGLRLDREPTAKGIYIHNGRVVVIK